MVIFKPTAILVYFKKRKEALKIDLGYHIQKKKKPKKTPLSALYSAVLQTNLSAISLG